MQNAVLKLQVHLIFMVKVQKNTIKITFLAFISTNSENLKKWFLQKL